MVGVAGIGGLAATAEAGTGAVRAYGPPPPPPPSLPGFTTVITSQTIGPAGGVIGPVGCDGATFTLDIPAGAFPTAVQITLTCGNLAFLAPFAFTGFTLDAALGVQVALNGALYPGLFLKALSLIADDTLFTPASVVGIWNGASFINDLNETSAPGVDTVSFDSDPAFGFMSPTTTKTPTVTTPVTG